MDDHRSTRRAAQALLRWSREMLREKAVVALTALKHLESERALATHESTRDQVRRALEAAGIVFMASDQGLGVLLINDDSTGNREASQPARPSRPRAEGGKA